MNDSKKESEGSGLETQERATRKHKTGQGWVFEPAHVFRERLSGAFPNALPELLRLPAATRGKEFEDSRTKEIVSKSLYRRTKSRPMILPVVTEL